MRICKLTMTKQDGKYQNTIELEFTELIFRFFNNMVAGDLPRFFMFHVQRIGAQPAQ